MSDRMMISNSKAKTYRRCPKQFDFKYNLKLVPRVKKRPLELGSWVHELLMHHYDGEDWRVAHRRLTEVYNSFFEEEREALGPIPDDAERMMYSYLRTYPDDLQHYRVIETELDEMVELPNGDTFRFIIDLVVEDLYNGGIWLWDHKNVSKFMPDGFMLLDSQLARYFWSAKRVGIGSLDVPLRGVLFNELRTKAPTVPKLLKSGRLTQQKNQDTDVPTYVRAVKELDTHDEPWEDKIEFYRATLRRIKAQQTGRFFRRTHLDRSPQMTKQLMRELIMTTNEIRAAQRRNRFPRTVDKSCLFSCDYTDLCQLQLQGADTSATIKLKYTRKKDEKEVDKK